MRLHRMAGAIAAALFILAGLIALRGFIDLFPKPNPSQDRVRAHRRMAGAIAAALLILAGLIALRGSIGLFGTPRAQEDAAWSPTIESNSAGSQAFAASFSPAPPWPAPTPTLVSWTDAAQNWAVAAFTVALTPTEPPLTEEPTPGPDESVPAEDTTASNVSSQPAGPAAVAADEPPPPPPAYQAYDMANAVLSSVSAARAAHGLGALSVDGALTAAAQTYAQFLADTDTFTHDGEGGLLARVRAAGYSGGYVGEAIWEGWGAYVPDEIVNEWLNSPAHRAILLGAVYTDAGVACYVVESNSSTRCVLDAGAP